MDQLEAAFRLADGLDGEGPEVGGTRRFQADVDAEPLVGQTEAEALCRSSFVPSWPRMLPWMSEKLRP